MKNLVWTQNLMRATTWLMAAATPWVIGCVKGGGITSSSSSSSISGTLTIDKVYPTAQGDAWTPIVSSSRYYIKGLSLTITGTCSRGIDSIHASDNVGSYSETASCDVNGNFSYTHTFTGPIDADRTVTLAAYDVTGLAISGASKSKDIHIDNTDPVVPVFTAPATGSPTATYPYSGSSNSVPITGTCSADTNVVVGPNGTQITPAGQFTAGCHWTYNATVIAGSSLDFSFQSYDLAGNNSSVITMTIQWTPSIDLKIKGPLSGGFAGNTAIADSHGSGKVLAGTISSYQGRAIASPSGFKLEAGFNYISTSSGAR